MSLRFKTARRTSARESLIVQAAAASGRRVSDRQIARECQFSKPFVSALRRQLEKGAPDLERTVRTASVKGDLTDGEHSSGNRRDLQEEARILEGRLESRTLERLKLTDLVIRGVTSRDVLTRTA